MVFLNPVSEEGSPSAKVAKYKKDWADEPVQVKHEAT
jgi:hypothetical protein